MPNVENSNQNVLITTAISYPNSKPHIGHLYEALLADFLTRSSKIFGNQTKLLTGTDEHGKKIQSTARLNSMSPIDFCNFNVNFFKSMLEKCQIKYDRFIRTTDEDHVNLVKESICKAEEFIEKSEYTGYYNVREETFVAESEAILTNYCDPVTNIPYERRSEINYKFKLSLFKTVILNHLDKVKNFDTKCLMSLIEDLQDLSISRIKSESFDWGIEYPNDPEHVIYVWFDALLNYITGRNSLFSDLDKKKIKTLHVIGKDIVRFHSVIYPAILKSIDEDVYDFIHVHGFVVDEQGRKMSKSLGNVISPDELIEKYSIDMIRFYFFMESSNEESDIKFSESKIVTDFNIMMVKQIGNLIQRYYKLIDGLDIDLKSFTFTGRNLLLDNFHFFKENNEKDEENNGKERNLEFDLPKIRSKLFQIVYTVNSQITNMTPWKLETEERRYFMSQLSQHILDILTLLSIVIPEKVKEINRNFGFLIPGLYEDHELDIGSYSYIKGFKVF